jgi:hypothetical protein
MALLPVKCKPTELYVERTLAGEFTWLVYNKVNGLIVAATYDRNMAETILSGIKVTHYYSDDYGITEVWKSPEPMIE